MQRRERSLRLQRVGLANRVEQLVLRVACQSMDFKMAAGHQAVSQAGSGVTRALVRIGPEVDLPRIRASFGGEEPVLREPRAVIRAE